MSLFSEKVREALRKIIEHEECLSIKLYGSADKSIPWELMEVPVEWSVVKPLIMAGIVEKCAKKSYRLKDRSYAKKLLEELEEAANEEDEELEVPDDLFSAIEGYEDVKALLRRILEAEGVHVLLVGPPASGKSLFLMELERVRGRTKMLTAGTVTKVGLRDIIAEERPKLLIDEIDKISDPNDLSVLLTWMETGRVIVATHHRREEHRCPGILVAAANSTKKLPPELLDRFLVLRFKKYSEEEFKRVCVKILTTKGCDEELAKYIADKVAELGRSVREAVRIASLAKSKADVDAVVSLLKKYS